MVVEEWGTEEEDLDMEAVDSEEAEVLEVVAALAGGSKSKLRN